MSEQQVKLAAKMYEFRDFARRIYGDRYRDKITEAAKLFRRAPVEPIRFIPWLSGEMAKRNKTIADADVLLFTAATVELIENPEEYQDR